jgi:hypothetical protein
MFDFFNLFGGEIDMKKGKIVISRIALFVIVCIGGLMCGCIFSPYAAGEVVSPVPAVKIWDKGRHNAFTDLIRFKGKFYCTFREGTVTG